jgi:hypothetical protein
MAEAFVVAAVPHSGMAEIKTTTFYVILAETEESAVSAIEEVAGAECQLELNASILSPETIRDLKLKPGEPRKL